MTDAPERICTSQCGKTLVHDGMKRFETDVEYIRTDHVDALLKAEREKALREAAEEARHYGHESYAAMMISDAIIDLTKKDATDG